MLAGAVLLPALHLLWGCAASPAQSEPPEAAPLAATCPARLPTHTRCLRGTDSAGAPYLIALPEPWSGVLVMHVHGGPTLGPPKASRADEDAQRWAIVPRLGHAYAASVFHQGGVAVHSAAADSERVRRIFVQHVAKPRRTLLHGQSWGAGVAAVAAERYPHSWDGVLLSSGVLGGGSHSYDFRLDLRVVYQALCGNHPRADEPAYPLWMGLPADATLTRAQLAGRVHECLGLRSPAAQRTPEQAARVATIVNVIRIPEASILPHLNWATWHFQDIALHRSGGASAFGNVGVQYRGSPDDAALNARVLRYAADPAARARFAADTDPGGRIDVPVLTVHGIGDATAFVELEHHIAATMAAAGRSSLLVQTFVDRAEHSGLGEATYAPLFEALLQWVEQGRKPTPAGIAQRCLELVSAPGASAGSSSGCAFAPQYAPAPLSSRVPAR